MTAPTVSENVASRFKILERPTLSPGKCAVCGAVNRPVVDFGLNLQRYGAVMLCETCVCEAAERVGMIRPETLEEQTMQSGQSVTQYLMMTDQRVVPNELYDAISHLVGVHSSLAAAGTVDVSGYLDDETTESVPGQPEFVFGDNESDDSGPVGEPLPFDL